ncbi:helix-turn-helix domain-containing protein [Breznakiellaceae bacterium SP9]
MDFIDRIRAVRKSLGINQGEFARRIGLTQTAMSMIEVGKSKLTEKNIKLICATFNINEGWFRMGEGETFVSASPYEAELVGVFTQLMPDTQEFLLEMARALLQKQKKRQAEEVSPGV